MIQVTNATPWGWATAVDLYQCNPEFIRSAEKIKGFVEALVSLLEMRAFGEVTIVNFGEDEKIAGFSMTQLIETSLISGHFANASNAAYIDIFSCKTYDAQAAADFAQSYFEAEQKNVQTTIRH